MVIDRATQGADLSSAVILVDKPSGLSSFDVIRRLRRATGIRKIGHAGTLDPMATGLLICMTGKATKTMASLVELDKSYCGTIRLGESTASYDAETDVVQNVDASHITRSDIEEAAREFSGTIVQTSPPFSAIKVGGERLYRKARRGEKVQAPPRVVTIYEFGVTGLQDCDAEFFVRCSKGTYIRSLAHDLGRTLGVGAHLIRLRRLAVGPYSVDNALSLDEVEAMAQSQPSDSAGA